MFRDALIEAGRNPVADVGEFPLPAQYSKAFTFFEDTSGQVVIHHLSPTCRPGLSSQVVITGVEMRSLYPNQCPQCCADPALREINRIRAFERAPLQARGALLLDPSESPSRGQMVRTLSMLDQYLTQYTGMAFAALELYEHAQKVRALLSDRLRSLGPRAPEGRRSLVWFSAAWSSLGSSAGTSERDAILDATFSYLDVHSFSQEHSSGVVWLPPDLARNLTSASFLRSQVDFVLLGEIPDLDYAVLDTFFTLLRERQETLIRFEAPEQVREVWEASLDFHA